MIVISEKSVADWFLFFQTKQIYKSNPKKKLAGSDRYSFTGISGLRFFKCNKTNKKTKQNGRRIIVLQVGSFFSDKSVLKIKCLKSKIF